MAIIKRNGSKAKFSKLQKYLSQEEKTEEKLISAINCSIDNIVKEFELTKEIYNKNKGIQYYHIIQSFAPTDNITPEKAHNIGKELSNKCFKGFEIYIVTHKDKQHIHNHIVINSVGLEGKKYYASNKSLWDIKRASNEICSRENIATIDLSKKAEKRITDGEYRITLRGGETWKEEIREVLEYEIKRVESIEELIKVLNDNYEIDVRTTKNSISFKHPITNRSVRGKRLGDRYTKESLINELNKQKDRYDGSRDETTR